MVPLIKSQSTAAGHVDHAELRLTNFIAQILSWGGTLNEWGLNNCVCIALRANCTKMFAAYVPQSKGSTRYVYK